MHELHRNLSAYNIGHRERLPLTQGETFEKLSSQVERVRDKYDNRTISVLTEKFMQRNPQSHGDGRLIDFSSRDRKAEAQAAFRDLHVLHRFDPTFQNFRDQWGNQADAYINIYNEATRSTPQQRAIASADYYLQFRGVMNDLAASFAETKAQKDGSALGFSNQAAERNLAGLALEDLYFIKKSGDTDELRRFKRDYGLDADHLESLLDRSNGLLDELEASVMDNAGTLSSKDKTLLLGKVIRAVEGMQDTQQENLLREIGTTRQEYQAIKRRIVASGILYGAIYFAGDNLTDLAGIKLGLDYPVNANGYSDPAVVSRVVSGEAAFLGSKMALAKQTNRILKDPRIQVFNPSPIIVREIARRVYENEEDIDRATELAFMANPGELYGLVHWYATLADPSIFYWGDIAQSIINGVQYAVTEGSYRLQQRRLRQEDERNGPTAPTAGDGIQLSTLPDEISS